ncbi:ammonium transporter [Cellvibrio zantedeschiae]|uniref:Ammonium transporter n=1 Tax=Cellvibrio zantedeschiae TaxID=1237077 RepID=A0ABQ3B870_9GAMM|nr:ammonium transporter [Cellvibrio zantedeschiae]GGY82857.1 ammonium transporter [Cellvibrio zantedeschiae]
MRLVSISLAVVSLLFCFAVAPVFAQDASSSSISSEAGETTAPVAEVPAAVPLTSAVEAVVEPPMTKPTLVSVSKISAGDTAWMLVSTALVLLMTIPGVALFYTGMVRKKNVLATMAHSFAATCIVSILWVIVGYSIAFTPGVSPWLGSLDRFMLNGMDFIKETGMVTVHHVAQSIPESVFMMFQMTFAIITPALITGAFAERMKFSALVVFIAFWSLLVYAPVAHWVWEPTGWLASLGVLDFAGGTVVHINAGVSGLVAAIIVGPRLGFGRVSMPPHNLILTVIGASLLWVGWFGFNAGSAGAADGRAGMAMFTTQLATAAAAMTWMLIEWFKRRKPSVLGMVSGAVAGLVAITPASGFVGVTGAFAIGISAGIACYWGATWLKSTLGYDDSLDVFGVHAIGGIVGALLTGVFAVKSIGGVEGSIAIQAIGVITTVIYASIVTAIILLIIDKVMGLRVEIDEENEGLDIEQHGEQVL